MHNFTVYSMAARVLYVCMTWYNLYRNRGCGSCKFSRVSWKLLQYIQFCQRVVGPRQLMSGRRQEKQERRCAQVQKEDMFGLGAIQCK